VAGDPDITYDYYYSGYQVVEVRKDGDADPYEQYVWGLRYIHSPVCRWRDADTDGASIQTLYYTNDANFNVTALVETDGDVAERYTYDPYGKRTIYDDDWSDEVAWANSEKNEVLFTGHRLDTETGLYYCLARHYHPTMGRWLWRDPLKHGPGMHRYQYVRSNTLRFTDPLGLASTPPPGPMSHFFAVPVGFEAVLMKDLHDLCPCFSYTNALVEKKFWDGNKTYRIIKYQKISISKVPTDAKEKARFCCCYYRNLPGCNVVLAYGIRGGYEERGVRNRGRMWPENFPIKEYSEEVWLDQGDAPSGHGPFARIGHLPKNPRGLGQEIYHGVTGYIEAEAEPETETYNWAMDGNPNSPLPYKNTSIEQYNRIYSAANELLTDRAGCEQVMGTEEAKSQENYNKATAAKAKYDAMHKKIMDNIKENVGKDILAFRGQDMELN